MWRLYKVFVILTFFALPSRLLGQTRIELIDSSQVGCSFRGLSVVTDKVVWVSGTKGTVGRSVDGGQTWTWMQVLGFEKSDFRDIEAFDKNRAVIMASGTPAVILKTEDGGQTWKLVFKDDRPEMFLDAMDFWDNKHGIMVGDPINGHFVLMQTNDGGSSWKMLDSAFCPVSLDSEAVFAASGTSLRCWGKDEFGFVTGGGVSRLVLGKQLLAAFTFVELSIPQGYSSAGAFSFSKGKHYFKVVGGDYLCDTCVLVNSCNIFKSDGLYSKPVAGSVYTSCIELTHGIIKSENGILYSVVTGTSYTEVTHEVFVNQHGIYIYPCLTFSIGFNVVRQSKAKKGKAVFLAGSKGRIGKLIY